MTRMMRIFTDFYPRAILFVQMSLSQQKFLRQFSDSVRELDLVLQDEQFERFFFIFRS